MNFRILFAAAGLISAMQASAQADVPWFLSSSDSLCGVRLTEVGAPKGSYTPPRRSVEAIVAVIDGGFDISHPDLTPYIWTNPRETADNDRDDDRNGFVDDMHGWNFLGNSSGDVFLRAGTEPFREYKRLRPLYRDADTSALSAAQKSEYAYYRKMERTAKLDTYIAFADYLRTRAEAFAVCDSLMGIYCGAPEATIGDFQQLELADTTGLSRAFSVVVATPFMFVPELPWRDVMDKVRGEYELAAQRVASLDGNDDDPHRKLGNDPSDFGNLRYGNNLIDGDPYHGTMVAGVIAACASALPDAGRGIRIQCIRAIPEGDEYDRDVAAAIRYAVDNGARVINMSFGKYLSPHWREVRQAMRHARKKDVLLVMASGNDGIDCDATPIYPVCRDEKGRRLENLVVVGASTPGGVVASFSNYGRQSVDLLAPGENIRSTAPGGQYDTAQGTSIAAPVVTGIAALIRASYPDLSARTVREILMRTAADISKREMHRPGHREVPQVVCGESICVSGGIVDAKAALEEASKISKYGKR